MTAVMPLTIMHVKSVEAASSSIGVVASGYSGLEIAGAIGGLIGIGIAAVTLVLGVIAGNAKRRRQYTEDLRQAKQEGRSELADDLDRAMRRADEFEARYLNLLESRAGHRLTSVPPRPSLRHNRPEPGHDDDDEGEL